MKVIILLCTVILAAIAMVLVARAIRSNAGVPSLDDPKNVTPPLARDMNESEGRDEPSYRAASPLRAHARAQGEDARRSRPS